MFRSYVTTELLHDLVPLHVSSIELSFQSSNIHGHGVLHRLVLIGNLEHLDLQSTCLVISIADC